MLLVLILNFLVILKFAQLEQVAIDYPTMRILPKPHLRPTNCYYATEKLNLDLNTTLTRQIRFGECESISCTKGYMIEVKNCPPADPIRSCPIKLYSVPPPFPDCCGICDEEATRRFEEKING
uniref:CSON001429 protein n=1 Tax=Culicoides sonorensis TaxID=179676 RepID=A0A336MH36_CULSO